MDLKKERIHLNSLSMSTRSPVIFFFILLQLFSAFPVPTSSSSSCPSSSCGNISDIRFPFRLQTDPKSCGEKEPRFHLDCQNNQTVMSINSKRYFVQEIHYPPTTQIDILWMRVLNPGINKENISSCPIYSNSAKDWFRHGGEYFPQVLFIHCASPVNSTKFVKAPFCGNRSNTAGDSSKLHSYLMYVESDSIKVSDLEESCTVDKVVWISDRAVLNSSSLASIYDAMAYGFWIGVLTTREQCWRRPTFKLAPSLVTDNYCCYNSSQFNCVLTHAVDFGMSSVNLLIDLLLLVKVIGFMIGFPLLIWLVVHKWRRRHFSMDKAIEEFLRDQHTLAPIQYTYSEIKKMSNNFSEKLGEGGYGIVYKGKLRSGPFVAIKLMEQSMATEEEFISEVGTIGQIHHVNVVQLIGYCVGHSKYALVYEFLPNGSLDRYIFNPQSVGILPLTFSKMFEIALGVARGINYLHHGCHMQILHFDIKPHNILLDEMFNPKVSDFGLARFHPTHESFINLTVARGTVGYMAPELFYKNIGRVSYKVDVYSFGMMLMEMASRRKNMNHLVEEMSKTYFPSWVYEQLCTGKDIDVNDATQEEKFMVKKIMIVALWCLQIRPSDRPSMNKVVEMLEDNSEPRMPPKPFVVPCEIAHNDDGITQSYSIDYVNFI